MVRTSPRKVLMLADSLGAGGAERQLALLAASLQDEWRASVFSLGAGIFADRIRELGIPLELAPRRFKLDVAPFFRLWQTIGRTRPDVVHSWGHMACFAAEAYCRPRRIPHVAGVIRRGAVYSVRGRFPRLASRLGDLALANSRAGLVAFGVPDRRGRVLYNGFPAERLERAPVPISRPGEFHVVMAATMDDRKDFPLLIEAIRRLRSSGGVRVRGTLLGDGPFRETWRTEAADLIEDGALAFPGRVEEILDHLGNADAGVLLGVPGWGEGISNSIMEYMAARLPVVATENGGNPELVIPGETGFLVKAADVEGVVAALRGLMADPERARAMGQAGRRRVETVFSVPAMIETIVSVYAEALDLRGR
ncbi:MAG: glycosyltransferase [Candidatus Krumholzibacteriia bacterium]